jgi:hypothetical protein
VIPQHAAADFVTVTEPDDDGPTVWMTCVGDPVLCVHADIETAERVAARLGFDLSRRCGQCGDLSLTPVERDLEVDELARCATVVDADEVDALLGD